VKEGPEAGSLAGQGGGFLIQATVIGYNGLQRAVPDPFGTMKRLTFNRAADRSGGDGSPRGNGHSNL
jgi:hypothetical protein